ncbi:hypothetical protein A3J41_03050 [candidate division TM6 bacterium RIFCSPHIGHO2_12_FULL_38_8]|nr:MAG: hypothetical protein A3J41_03050 [candidate division TM6 bacterium RIFCSPHIGHO2_12_FULL_38_8]
MFTCTLLTCTAILQGAEQKNPPFRPISPKQQRVSPTPAQGRALFEHSEPDRSSVVQNLLTILSAQQEEIKNLLADSKEQSNRTDLMATASMAASEIEKTRLLTDIAQLNAALQKHAQSLAKEQHGWQRKIKNGLWFLAGSATGGTVSAVCTLAALCKLEMIKWPTSTTPAAQ